MPGFNTWIRLVREGTYLRADYSSDGFSTWKVVGVTSVDMPLAVSAGVAVTSQDVTQLNTSLVDQVAIMNGEP
jgi:hypothetical protein